MVRMHLMKAVISLYEFLHFRLVRFLYVLLHELRLGFRQRQLLHLFNTLFTKLRTNYFRNRIVCVLEMSAIRKRVGSILFAAPILEIILILRRKHCLIK